METKKVGIIGIKGAYGKWLKSFFEELGHEVTGADPELNDGPDNTEIVSQSDVIIFSVPMSEANDIIKSLTDESRPDHLWVDITSLKSGPIDAMMNSKAEVIGLHPMYAPTVRTWKGQTVVICPVRARRWLGWIKAVLKESGANVQLSAPEDHDDYMAYVQALPHLLYLLMASTLRKMQVDVSESLKYSTPPYRLAWATMARILSLNPNIYADVQMCNFDHTSKVIKKIAEEIGELSQIIEDCNRERFREEFFASKNYLGTDILDEGAALFEQIMRITADLAENNSVLIQAKQDYPGLLYEILGIFRESGINMTSLHSFKSEDGYRFQIGFENRRFSKEVQEVLYKLRTHDDLGRKIEILPV